MPLLHWKGAVAVHPRVKGIVFRSFGAPINYDNADIESELGWTIRRRSAAVSRRDERSRQPMLGYFAHRLVIAVVAVFILATITFFLLRLVPGDRFPPADHRRGEGAAARALRPR